MKSSSEIHTLYGLIPAKIDGDIQGQVLKNLVEEIYNLYIKSENNGVKLQKLFIVNDGSKIKNIFSLIQEKYKWVEVINNDNNRGVAYSLYTGYNKILEQIKDNYSGVAIFRLDADGEHNPAKIKDALRELNAGKAGCIVHINYQKKHQKPWDRAINKLLGSKQGNFILGKPFYHNCPGYTVYRAAVFVEDLLDEYRRIIGEFEEFYKYEEGEFRWGGDLVIMWLVTRREGVASVALIEQNSRQPADKRSLEKVIIQTCHNLLVLSFLEKYAKKNFNNTWMGE